MGAGRVQNSEGWMGEFVMNPPLGVCSYPQLFLGHQGKSWRSGSLCGNVVWASELTGVHGDRAGEYSNVPEILSCLNLLYTSDCYDSMRSESLIQRETCPRESLPLGDLREEWALCTH